MIAKRLARVALLSCVACAWVLLGASSPAAAKTRTAMFDRCVSTAVAIPDGPLTGTTAPNPIASFAVPVRVPRFRGKPQPGVVTAVDSAGVRISHADDGDLALFLVSPGGRGVSLVTYRDESSNDSGNGFGSGAASCSGSLVRFGDAFGRSITTPGNTGNDTPITGLFKPEQPLSTFVGGPARGFWTLLVEDLVGPDTGTINAVSLDITYRYKVKRKRRR
jgi:hypothetical protein